MKTLPTLLLSTVAILATLTCQAQVLHIKGETPDDEVTIRLPRQFIVTPAGIKYVKVGEIDAVVVGWDKINLEALAAQAPQIEEARQSAVLSDKSTWFTVAPAAPRVNYYRQFLDLPVNITFQKQTLITTNTVFSYATSLNGFTEPGGSFEASGFIDGGSHSTTLIQDKTLPTIATTMGGLFLALGDDTNQSARNALKALQHRPGFFQNIQLGLEDLHTAYPKDSEIATVTKAIIRLGHADSSVDIDAVRELTRFERHCEQLARGS